MAGWVLVWSRNQEPLAPERWQRCLRVIAQDDTIVATHEDRAVALGTWHRTAGEFPYSGKLTHHDDGTVTAWVGQCLEDDGDASDRAIELLGRAMPDLDEVARLNGMFAAAIVHPAAGGVSVWTDRHKHYPVYAADTDDWRVASTELRCVLPWLTGRTLNLEAIDLLLRTGELIDRMTLLKEVDVVPSATWLHDDGRELSARRYWRLRFAPEDGLGARQVVERVGAALTTALRRIQATNTQLGVPLSGGLDSRLLLGLCAQPQQVPSFTWGLPECRDIQCAASFAAAVGAPHHVRHWEPAGMPAAWRRGVVASAGGFGVHEMHVLPFVDLVAEHCTAVLNGLAGDALLGGNFLKWSWLREPRLEPLAEMTWGWRVSPEQDMHVNRILKRRDAIGAGRRAWVQSIQQHNHTRPAAALNEWLFENRVFRFTNCGTLLFRQRVESYAPFFDRDVVDLLLRVPLESKLKHGLYLRVLRHACPAAANVRWQRTMLPPAWGYWPNLASMAGQRALQRAARALGRDAFPGLAPAKPTEWFRTQWRKATENLLLGERTLDRGLFDPEALRVLWRAHQAGANLTTQLGTLLTIELFAREMVDDEYVAA